VSLSPGHYPAKTSSSPSSAELGSALFDGESDRSDQDLSSLLREPAVLDSFTQYARISDALHPGGLQLTSKDFTSRVMQAVAQEPVHLLPAQRRGQRQRNRVLSGLAAGVGALGFVSAAYFVAMPVYGPSETTTVAQSAPSQVAQPGGGATAVPALQTVRASSPWQDPDARRLIDAHGPTVVKMRLESEQP